MTSIISKNVFLFKNTLNYCAYELNVNNLIHRLYSTKVSKLLYYEYGDPIKVINKVDEDFNPNLKDTEVLIKMIASPVNPADINTIQGKYPVKPTLPSVPGNEGVGEIVSVGKEVQNLSIGDHVIPLVNALGTWQTHAVLPANTIYKVPKKLGIVEAATLTVNPCTAYRMLRDFVSLKPGDTVIQNGANSAVGQYVTQIARVWGLKTVNIVRNRPNIDELKHFLSSIGATHVLTEEELRTTKLFKSGMNKPKLALNCVGGKSALELLRYLDYGATMVTVGGMSREPIPVPAGPLIFKDLRIRGFWMTNWTIKHFDSPDRREMLEELITMMINNEIKGPVVSMVPFDNFKEALNNAMTIKGMIGKKYILNFQ